LSGLPVGPILLMTTIRENYVRTHDGLRLFYRDYEGDPDRLPVLCLPGLTRNSRDFEVLAGHLAPTRRVITPDMRGRGRSDRDPHWIHYIPTVYVEDMWVLLNHLGIDRVAVIGTSLGGIMGMMMGAMRPHAVAGLVLNDVGPELDPVGAQRIRNYAGRIPAVKNWADAVALMKSMHSAAYPDFTDEQWLALARGGFRENAEGVPVYDADPAIGNAVRAMPANAGFALWFAFAALRWTPVMLLRGELSDVLSVSIVERMRREKPDMTVVTIPNRGHAPVLHRPVSRAAIERFLSRLP
jgi:pimeloyl-ACP methyl ester carboxylesterase